MNNQQQVIFLKGLPLGYQKEIFSSIKGVGLSMLTEKALEVTKSSRRNKTLLYKLTYQNGYNKKRPFKKPKFTDWKMPPAPQQYFKSKNNDPL